VKARFLIPAVSVAVLFGFFWYALKGGNYDPQLIDSPLIDRAAPDFSTTSLADPNQPVALKQFLGKPFVVNFWGTWCVGCREEHPELLAIASESEIPIVGIDWKDEHAAAVTWLAELGNPYHRVGVDDDGKIAIDWGVYGAPESYLVNAAGRIIHKHVGPMTLDIWRKEFLKRLPPGAAK
jgi:cytochrome c biogenesis protein CcmG, thiol:disulfide interchange protein DsbE